MIFQSLRTARRKNRRPFYREAESKQENLFALAGGLSSDVLLWQEPPGRAPGERTRNTPTLSLKRKLLEDFFAVLLHVE